jgi:HMG box factor
MESREIQAKSVEAMVMTIPYVNKIKVLAKISPSLAPPGPASPGQEIRGAVVAIESADRDLLTEIGVFVHEHLSKDNTCVVKTWRTSATSPKQSTPTPDTEMTDAGGSAPIIAPSKPEEKDPFVEYLSIISEWHTKSQEMIKFITTTPAPPTADPSPTTSSITDAPLNILPIALVPRGFSLTTSDTFALRIPINDSYAPVDHWQWMATLWRGIVGPDLAIYVNRVGRDEMNKYGGVEIRGDCAAIIVRVPESGKMDEKTARRLGFEVMEFVRGIESGFGRT